MKRTLLRASFALIFLATSSYCTAALSSEAPPAAKPQAKAPAILPLSDVKPGLRGIAYTVFEGTKPEPMDVEVLGVLKNLNGPKSDIILARLHGAKVEYTGVVAGMSGSPVYVDGKLIGAISLRIGQMSKEPICGITPIEEMLEINELDRSTPGESVYTPGKKPGQNASTVSGGDPEASIASYARYMEPIAAPLVFTGFTESTLQRFGAQFAAAGVLPVLGAGAASDMKQPEPIEPGSSVGIVLVRGDMDISATCTVTYMDADRLLACGHPLMQSGSVEMPMTKSTVVATLPSPLNAFKIAETTETVGTFMQDRHTGVMGRFGEEAHMVPVTLTLHGGPKPKEFHYEMLNSPRLTPVAMMATLYNALEGVNEHGDEISYRMHGSIQVKGYPAVTMENMFAPSDTLPTALAMAFSIGNRFGRIYDNAYQQPAIESVDLDLDIVHEHRSAKLESARTDVTEARPGDEVVIETVLRPYRGERIVRRIPIRIPTSTPKGNLRILVSDGDTLDRARNITTAAIARKLDLGATIAALNKEHVNHKLYVSLLDTNPQAMVEDKVMPTLPLSVINVMDGMRGTQDMVVLGESAVDEASTPLDYVVSGSQVISLTVK